MNHSIYLYILVAGLTSTLVRVIPSTLIRRQIKNQFIQSFLYYLPYVTLAVMTFPAIINCTDNKIAGVAALIVALIISWFYDNLFVVAISSCIVVFICQLFL